MHRTGLGEVALAKQVEGRRTFVQLVDPCAHEDEGNDADYDADEEEERHRGGVGEGRRGRVGLD